MSRTDEFVTVDGTELHYSAWGPEDAQPVVCVHGLSRVGRDFDPLAEALSDEYRVLAVDMPGRGLSEWADDPETEYAPDALAATCVGFCDALGLDSLHWAGISMGGMLGMALAAGPLADRMERLVLVDVGPDPADDEDAQEGIDRIVGYLTDPPAFDRLTDLEAYFRETYATFSAMDDDEWRRFTLTSARRRDDGRFTPNYDVDVVEPLLRAGQETDPWETWEAIDVPTLVLRGRESDILAAETFEEMKERRPEIETREYDCGHAPALNVPEQTDPVREFLA